VRTKEILVLLELMVQWMVELVTGIQGNKGDTGLAGSDGANGTDGSWGNWSGEPKVTLVLLDLTCKW
jgi:hypothetical protein